MTKRLIDIVHRGKPDDIPPHLVSLSKQADTLALRIQDSVPRSDRRIACANFCSFAGGELRRLSRMYPNDVAGMAWVTRNLFEADLTVGYVLLSDDNLRRWLGQMLKDESDFIEGMLAFSREQPDGDNKRQLRDRLNELSGLSARHEVEFSKPFRTEALAKELGEVDEYVGLYKLLSKYVHPTSLLINAYGLSPSDEEWINMFLVKAQVYAGQIIGRVTRGLKIS